MDGSEILDMNERFLKIFGRTREEMQSDSSVIHWVDPHEREEMVRRLNADGRVRDFECKMLNKQGEVRTCITSLRLYHEQGVLEGSIIDVTERKRVESALAESEEKFSKLFRNSPDAITLTDLTNNALVDVNESYTRISGYSREETIGRTTVDLGLNPNDRNKFITALKEKGRVLNFEAPFKTKAGAMIICSVSGELIELHGKPHLLGVVRDHTERKRTEEAVRESEERFRQVFEQGPLGVAILDLDYRWVSVNPKLCEMLGYAQDELTKLTAVDVTHPDDIEADFDQHKKVLQGEIPVKKMEKRYIKKTGEVLWTRLTGSLVRDDQGKATYFLAMIEDITERKRAEKELEKSERKYRDLFEGAPVGIFQSTIDGRVIGVNPAYAKMYGYASAEEAALEIDNVAERIYVEPERRKKLIDLALRTDGFVKAENQYRRKDGSLFWGQLYFRVVRDRDGEVKNLEGFVEDITESKKAEEALRLSEERYRRLFEDAPLMYAITRNERGIPLINDCNGLFLCSLGYTREEVVGRPLADFYSPKSRADLLEHGGYARALAGEFFIGERQLLKRDGRLIPTLLYTAPEVGLSGEVIGTCAMFVDVTEQKKAEEALRSSEAQLSSALTMAHLGHWEYDVATDLFTFNDHFYKIFGTTAEQVGGYTMSSADYARRFVHPEDRHIVGDEIRKSIETADSELNQQLEHRIVYANGETGYISVQIFLVKDDLGRTVRAYGVNQDLTQRVQMEALVRESEQRYRTLVEESFDGLFVYKGPKILFANRRLHEMLGYAPGELEGMDHTLLSHPDYRQVVGERASARLRGEGVTPQYEVLFQRKDGSTFEVEIRAKLINIMGEPGVQVWIRDVSEWKRSEQSQRRLATAVEQAAEVVVITDARGRIQYVNPAFGRITGTPQRKLWVRAQHS